MYSTGVSLHILMIFFITGKVDINFEKGPTAYIIVGAMGGTVVLVLVFVLTCIVWCCIRQTKNRKYRLCATEG